MSGGTIIRGRARVVTGTVSTDDILPARHKHRHVDPADLAPYVFEIFRPGLGPSLAAGDVLVGRDGTFGIGSSREQAVTALKAGGVVAVVAPRFGRIFFRNCWNSGLAAVELELPNVADGDEVAIELCDVDPSLLALLGAGGLLAAIASGELEW